MRRFYPGALYILAIFYTRKGRSDVTPIRCQGLAETNPEIASRVAILYTAQMAGLGFANLIAAGIFSGLNSATGIAGVEMVFGDSRHRLEK
jgi:hypothetical protein